MPALRRPRTPQPAAPPSADVRWMNALANLIFVLVAIGALVAAALWLLRAPVFPIRSIELEGEMLRNSVPTLRANAAPRLAGNFFSVDLQRSRQAFESVPWVRRAEVRRVWPDRLVVRLEEHHAAALWQGADEDSEPERLVNDRGEVFDANVGDVQDDRLPTLQGPEGSAAQMLALYRRLQPQLARLDMSVDSLHLSTRGSWRAQLDSGATIEMGRGDEAELMARAERFVGTYTEATGRWRAPLDYADLRHSDGYAIRLRGVTVALAAARPGANPHPAKTP
jgi:cell division protein FtsQ